MRFPCEHSLPPTKDPYLLSGGFSTFGDKIEVRLETQNPTSQMTSGQVFVERQLIYGDGGFNVQIAKMLRRLADSVENNWEER